MTRIPPSLIKAYPMRVPNWRTLVFNEGTLLEPILDDHRVVLWLPGTHDGEYHSWERISNVARAEVAVGQGICATAATTVRVRQRIRGFLGKLWQRFHETPGAQTWVLPNGESAEQCGERQTDRLLVWPEDETGPLDEARIRGRWPECNQVQQLGKDLYLVAGVQPPEAAHPSQHGPNTASPQVPPSEQAEQWLAAARRSGDRSREVSSLTDLGILSLRSGDAPRAVALLDEALALARQLGDQSRERDVLGNLGLAALAAGQASRARALLEQELTFARAAGDRFAEKSALDHLAQAHASLRDPVRALTFYEQALALARQVGDRQHEADLLWDLGIQYAEMGQRDQAAAQAQAAIDLLEQRGKPQAGWLAANLQKYRQGNADFGSGGTRRGADPGGPIDVSGWTAPPASAPAASGPGLLRMASAAVKSTAKFLRSGFKTVPPETHQKRVRTCATCEHHTGLRCKLCGCFTSAKAWLSHEECPIGKWPS